MVEKPTKLCPGYSMPQWHWRFQCQYKHLEHSKRKSRRSVLSSRPRPRPSGRGLLPRWRELGQFPARASDEDSLSNIFESSHTIEREVGAIQIELGAIHQKLDDMEYFILLA